VPSVAVWSVRARVARRAGVGGDRDALALHATRDHRWTLFRARRHLATRLVKLREGAHEGVGIPSAVVVAASDLAGSRAREIGADRPEGRAVAVARARAIDHGRIERSMLRVGVGDALGVATTGGVGRVGAARAALAGQRGGRRVIAAGAHGECSDCGDHEERRNRRSDPTMCAAHRRSVRPGLGHRQP